MYKRYSVIAEVYDSKKYARRLTGGDKYEICLYTNEEVKVGKPRNLPYDDGEGYEARIMSFIRSSV